MALAVSASLLFVLVVWRPDLAPYHTADEELRIAQAWVAIDVADPDAADPTRPPHADLLETDPDTLDPDVETLDTGVDMLDSEDGLPEWLLAAVSAELERDEPSNRPEEGNRNDG